MRHALRERSNPQLTRDIPGQSPLDAMPYRIVAGAMGATRLCLPTANEAGNPWRAGTQTWTYRPKVLEQTLTAPISHDQPMMDPASLVERRKDALPV
ncbi:hypothetical protein [Rhizobium sp. Leaf341]|uniref:hypothetical protein n=1 Tax=Rhizobium sp. Leaf341 TaxID=1736344 RepID=UPI0012E35408|nr:hypothetical protein [Rhizobium sp. Leaf341]